MLTTRPLIALGLTLGLILVVLLAVRTPTPTAGLHSQNPDGTPYAPCAGFNHNEIYLNPPPPVALGKYYTGQEISIQAVAQVYVSAPVGPNTPACDTQVADVTNTAWELIARPPGSSASISHTGNFNGRFTPDVDGSYTVRFIACPQICSMVFTGLTAFDLEAVTVDASFTTAGALPYPPQTDVVVPPFTPGCGIRNQYPCDEPVNLTLSDRTYECNDGGGVVDPQWVSVPHWTGPQDYETAEGKVEKSWISRKDDPFNHDTQDANVEVLLDSPYRYLLSPDPENPAKPYDLGVEWESGSWPDQYRPTLNDRVSVFGYWVLDCGHDPFYTEIHPAVGVAVHRARPVPLPESLGLGSNVYAPGVVSDIYFNKNAGEITSNCSWTGLHQSGPDGACIPVADDGGPNPIQRVYNYNIYLPPNPHDTLTRAGKSDAPDVGLYINSEFPSGVNPIIQTIETDELTYLHVELNLENYSGDTLSGRITAAWEYPSPDNWGMKQYEVDINSLDVHEDSDVTCHNDACGFVGIQWGGDWRLWTNIPNTDQEWSRIVNCDDCTFDDETYDFSWDTQIGPIPWKTGATTHNLGPTVKLFPGQLFSIQFTGYDDDGAETSDDLGMISNIFPPPDNITNYWPKNYCTDSDPEIEDPVFGVDISASHCSDYNVNYQIRPQGGIDATLTPAGQALYDASLVRPSDLQCHQLIITRCWDTTPSVLDFEDSNPNGMHPAGPKHVNTLGVFEPAEEEEFGWDDIDPEHLKQTLQDASPAQRNGFFDEFGQEMHTLLHDDHPAWEFVVLEGVLTPQQWQQHFGNTQFDWPVWGDGNCDRNVNAQDLLAFLRVSANIAPGAACLNSTDVNCDHSYDSKDIFLALRYIGGVPASAAPNPIPIPFPNTAGEEDSCHAIGEDVHLTFGLPSETPTPTPHGSATPTPTASPTPTPTPTPSPTPTPDTTGPTITNPADDPDPIRDGDGNCPQWELQTTISANVDDPSGIASVVLHYRFVDNVTPGPWDTLSPALNGVTGKWEIAINPPDGSPSGGRIDWYFEATDNAANTSFEPANAPTSYYSTTVNYCD